MECDALPVNHQNAKILTNGTMFGSKADGPTYLTCLSTGQWSDPIPNCILDESLLPSPTPASQQPTPFKPKVTSRRPTRPSTRYTTALPNSTPVYEEEGNCSKTILYILYRCSIISSFF